MTDPYSLQLTAVPRPYGGPEGLAWWVSLRLPWFRAMPFSGLERLELTVDGVRIAPESLVVRLDGELLSLDELRSTTRYWGVQDTVHVGVPSDTVAPAAGTPVVVDLALRMPESAGPAATAPRRAAKGAGQFEGGASTPWKLGVCSFSFAGELRDGRSIQSCLDRVGAIGGYGGVEILGAQLASGYPDPTRDDLRRLESSIRDAGLVPLVYGAYTDPGRRDAISNDDDLIAWAIPALDAAKSLGCDFARINFPPEHAIYERVAALADERDLVVLNELHAVTSSDASVIQLLETLDSLDSPNLGLTLDLSCVMAALPSGFVDKILRPVLPDAAVEIIVDDWQADEPEAETRERLEALGAEVATAAIPLLGRARRLFRRSDPSWLPDVLRHTRVVHGKFFEIQDGREPALATESIFQQFRSAGFDGHLLAEYEAHLWDEDPDTFVQLTRFRDLVTDA